MPFAIRHEDFVAAGEHALQCGIILVLKLIFFFRLFESSCHFGHYHVAFGVKRASDEIAFTPKCNSSKQWRSWRSFQNHEAKTKLQITKKQLSSLSKSKCWKTCCIQRKLTHKLNMVEIDGGKCSEACVIDFMCCNAIQAATVVFVPLAFAVCRHSN